MKYLLMTPNELLALCLRKETLLASDLEEVLLGSFLKC